MIVRYTTVGLVLATLCYTPNIASASRAVSRREIRSMPIVERPSRPGHFYGNAVRRNNSRSAGTSW